MSINPAIWRKASRWSRPAAFAVLVAACIAAVPWARLREDFKIRRVERDALASAFAEAQRENLTFAQVVVAHPAYMGKSVYWEVTPGGDIGSGYVEGRPNRCVQWTNRTLADPEMNGARQRVLARVAGVKDNLVYLEYLGRP